MHTRRIRVLGAVVVAAIAAGCASAGGSGGDGRGSRNIITAEEIATVQVNTAYELVERLRPQFLRGRGATRTQTTTRQGPEGPYQTSVPPSTATVYVDNVPVGGVAALRDVTATRVREIRYLDSREATTRFGTGHDGGAILVVTKG